MSFTICLQAFDHGTFSSFKRSIAWDIFGPHAFPAAWGSQLRYADQISGTLLIDDTDEIDGVSINRPGDSGLIDLHKVACLVPSAIYWGTSYCVANAAYIPGLPQWLIDAFTFQPPVVSTPDEFLNYLSKH
jgi:hypothetical protein